MERVRIGAAVLNQTPLDWPGNRRRILEAIGAARAEGISILCLPELCVCGYGCEDLFASADLLRRSAAMLLEILPETRGLIVSVGLPIRYHNAVFNAAALLCDGALGGLVAKRFLAGDGIHYEPRWFKAWAQGRAALLDLGELRVPLGDLLFDCGGVRVGFEICEDAWVANRPGAVLARRGVDVLLNPSASHFAFEKHEIRRRFVLEGSRALCCSYVYSNLLGNESGRAIYDGSAILASDGRILAEAPRFSYREWNLVSATIDVEQTRTSAARSATFQPLLVEEDDVVRLKFQWPRVKGAVHGAVTPQLPAWERGEHLKEEEFLRAVSLGLHDYLRKSHSNGFVLSLSGGADSSAVACLVHAMLVLALQELGPERLRERLAWIPDLPASPDPREWTRRLLLCAYQATAQSSEVTLSSARELASSLGARFLHLDVDLLVKGYIELIAGAIGRPLCWERDDIPMQNIQARVRGPSVWMLANLEGALLLATSNRSEAAVGYATMDGDTCGGLSPLAGIDKDFIRAWLRWLESEGCAEIGPISVLKLVNEQAPTAELRPRGRHQTDEDDLMPYPVLDAIERRMVHDKLSPAEILQELPSLFPEIPPDTLARHVRRFFTLWSRNQWKRERFAPSFHVDQESLDPKTWCRFPILSGGFETELAELEAE